MPAYRSNAEGEIREAVIARLREIRPLSRIIHEINVCQGGNRIDVLAVGVDEIIAVEIKSAKDKIDRLPTQIKAMKGVAHHVISALHEKFLEPRKVGAHAAHYEHDGEYFIGEAPKCVGYGNAWIYPVRRRCIDENWPHDSLATWREPSRELQATLPDAALDMLWREELQWLCSINNVSASGRSTRGRMMQDLRWMLTGKELTNGICAALRSRVCIEADPPHQAR